MFEWLWLFTYGILSAAASFEGLAIPEEIKIDSIALELQLHDNNTSSALSDNIQFNTNDNNNLRRSFRSDHPERFTDFIQAVIELLIKYDDDDIEKFFTTFNEEVSKYHYNGCKFSELTDNDAFRNFIATKFDEVKNIAPDVVRKKLLKISNHIDHAKQGRYEKDLIDYINSLYKQDSVKKFHKFLTNLKDYTLKTKKDLDLVKIVRDGMRSLIFNHYTNLDYHTRAAIKFRLLSYWKYYLASEPSLRSQLNPIERQLLGNLDEDAGIFYYTKEDKYTFEVNNVKYSKFLPNYPNLILDSKIMNTPPLKPIWHAYRTTPRYTSESTISYYNQDFDSIQTEMHTGANSDTLIMDNIPTTEEIYKKINEDYSNDDKPKKIDYDEYNNHYTTTDTYEVRASTAASVDATVDMYDGYIPTEQYQSKGRKVIKSKHKKPSVPRSKDIGNTDRSIASLYSPQLIDRTMSISLVMEKRDTRKEPNLFKQKNKKHYFKKPTTVLRAIQTNTEKPTFTQTLQKHKPFIEVVTMRPFVPRKVTNFKHITYEINLQKPTSGARRQMKLTTDYPSEIKHTTYKHNILKHNAAANYDDLSVQEFKQDGLRTYGKNYESQPTADTISIDKALFNRLQKLERELSKVKTIVSNDTETIKELKHNIQLEEKLNSKKSKEHTSAKVEHYKYESGETNSPFLEKLKVYYDENEKDPTHHLENNRRYMSSVEIQGVNHRKHNFDINVLDKPYHKPEPDVMLNERDGLSEESIKKEGDRLYQSDFERGVLPHAASLQQRQNDRENYFDSNENKYKSERYSRRAMINKVKEIKNKFDRARRKTKDYKIMDSLSAEANVDFDKEYIPNKDSFNTNMKDLEKYLHLMIPKEI